MTTKDYAFRCLALLIVWSGLAIPAVVHDFLIPVDMYDTAIAVMFFLSGTVLTIAIWCGPQFIRSAMKDDPPS